MKCRGRDGETFYTGCGEGTIVRGVYEKRGVIYSHESEKSGVNAKQNIC